jgi:hypothetical protein
MATKLFYGGALHFLVLRMEISSPFCRLVFWGGSCISGRFLHLCCKQTAIEDNAHFSVMLQQRYIAMLLLLLLLPLPWGVVVVVVVVIMVVVVVVVVTCPSYHRLTKYLHFLNYLSHRSLLRVWNKEQQNYFDSNLRQLTQCYLYLESVCWLIRYVVMMSQQLTLRYLVPRVQPPAFHLL